MPYLALVGPILYDNVSPVLPVLNAILLFFTIFFLLMTGFTDPGIIPRREILEISNNGELPTQFSDPANLNEEENDHNI